MVDDGKRTELVSIKVTERMRVDIARLADSRDRSTSDFLYVALRRMLYGDMVRLDAQATQPTPCDKVNHD